MAARMSESPDLTDAELEMVRRYGASLSLWPVDAVEKLSVGQSGSLVVRLTVAGQRNILKITTDPARLERAESELRMISCGPAELIAVMPRYIGGHAQWDVVCLVTEEHQPLPQPADIVDADWIALATALGSLHSAHVPPWLNLKPGPAPTVAAAVDAEKFWAKLGHTEAAKQAADLLRDRARQPNDLPSATVLEHGDCHTENIVRDESGAFRWIDWQEAHLGNGFGDLVFLWQRAEFTGANPPRQAMTNAYAAARNLHPGSGLNRAISLTELRLLFTSWPPFLVYGTPQHQERMTARLPQLVTTLI